MLLLAACDFFGTTAGLLPALRARAGAKQD
jgi:hypothetical protein